MRLYSPKNGARTNEAGFEPPSAPGYMDVGPDWVVQPLVAPRWPPGVSMAPTMAQAAMMARQFCVDMP